MVYNTPSIERLVCTVMKHSTTSEILFALTVDKKEKAMEQKKRRQRIIGLRAREGMQWHKGTLCQVRNEKSMFIKPLGNLPDGYNPNKDVYMYSDNISKYVLPLKGGDSMEFVLGDRDKEKPMARKVKVSQYSQRTSKELVDYITNLTEYLSSADCKKVLMETLSNTVMWSFLGSPILAEDGGLSVYTFDDLYSRQSAWGQLSKDGLALLQ